MHFSFICDISLFLSLFVTFFARKSQCSPFSSGETPISSFLYCYISMSLPCLLSYAFRLQTAVRFTLFSDAPAARAFFLLYSLFFFISFFFSFFFFFFLRSSPSSLLLELHILSAPSC